MKHVLVTKVLIAMISLLTISNASAAKIDDVYPSCSPTGITKACHGGSGFFAAYPGKYTMALTIGSRTFQDRVEIRYITRHPGMLDGAEVIAGDFYSPEAKLYSPLINGKIVVAAARGASRSSDGSEMSFEIRVTENGIKFPVYFTTAGTGGTACTSAGTAYSDAEKTKVFGTFVMTKDTPDCDCSAK